MKVSINQDRVWKWERAGWTLMGGVLLVGLLGTLLPGFPKESFTQGITWRALGKIKQNQAPGRLEVMVGPEATTGDELILRVASRELQNLEVQNIIPAPTKVQPRGDDYEYVFPVARKNEPLTVTFLFKGNRVGEMPVQVGLPYGETLAFSRFFQP